MSLTENSNQLFLPGGVQQTHKIAHISQFGPYTNCVLSKNINPSLVLVQPRKPRPFITERLLMGCK